MMLIFLGQFLPGGLEMNEPTGQDMGAGGQPISVAAGFLFYAKKDIYVYIQS